MEASNGFWKRSRRAVALALLVLSVAWLGLGVFQQAPSSGVLAVTEARAAQSSSDDLKAPNLEPKAPAVMPGKEEKPNAGGEKEKKAGKEEKIKPFAMVMSAIAGLVLFLYGVTQLAQGLGDLNSERMRGWTARFTSNRFAGVGTGIVATTLLESSSVTIIMTIAMVSGGILTFVQSLGVVLGANIGTAVGAQIIALEFEQYVPILMLAGLLLRFIGRSETRAKLGLVVLGFGLMFYGLEAIDDAVKPLRDHEVFMNMMRTLGENPVLGALVGLVFTVIIQSSSATIAIVITMAGSGLISLPAGVAIMLGAEIGTCADTLVATIGRGRPAARTGVFHFIFNLSSACIGIAFASGLTQLAQLVSPGASVGRQIANAQMIFNVLGVAIVLPFLPAIARALEKLIPDTSDRTVPTSRQAVPAE